MEFASSAIEIGRGITDFGFMVMCTAFYLISSASVILFIINRFLKMTDHIVRKQQQILDEILYLQKEQIQLIKQIKTG